MNSLNKLRKKRDVVIINIHSIQKEDSFVSSFKSVWPFNNTKTFRYLV